MSNPIGRPSLYNPDYHCAEIVRLGKLGYHVYQIAREFGVVSSTIYEWCLKHKDFSDSYLLAQEHAKAWILDKNMECMTQKDMNHFAIKSHTNLLMHKKDLNRDAFVHIKNFSDSDCYKHKIKCIIDSLSGGDISVDQAESVIKIIEIAVRCENNLTDVSDLIEQLKTQIDKIRG